MRRTAKAFSLIFCLTLVSLPLVGCGGVESEPVGAPMEDEDAMMEGVDTTLEPGA